ADRDDESARALGSRIKRPSGAPPLLKSPLLVVLLSLLLCAAASAADLPARFDPTRDAAADVAQAVSVASAQGRRVIVDVGGEWCSWCHILDRFIARHAEVRALIDERYVW